MSNRSKDHSEKIKISLFSADESKLGRNLEYNSMVQR